ncbi:hypothetical protein [Bradyrhizobium diversitatis]|uniref:Secreted protein n=1 Tax=Bradyrhizobium diversitatis TaxID=2755406 RepID=A0ABS0P6K6_9BRAD|nr:hypothetical protein [Bradyrhizobium diversitatis]MBH5388916.1 hypothetical protein [Bradyrhizobium diversitatis]
MIHYLMLVHKDMEVSYRVILLAYQLLSPASAGAAGHRRVVAIGGASSPPFFLPVETDADELDSIERTAAVRLETDGDVIRTTCRSEGRSTAAPECADIASMTFLYHSEERKTHRDR